MRAATSAAFQAIDIDSDSDSNSNSSCIHMNTLYIFMTYMFVRERRRADNVRMSVYPYIV